MCLSKAKPCIPISSWFLYKWNCIFLCWCTNKHILIVISAQSFIMRQTVALSAKNKQLVSALTQTKQQNAELEGNLRRMQDKLMMVIMKLNSREVALDSCVQEMQIVKVGCASVVGSIYVLNLVRLLIIRHTKNGYSILQFYDLRVFCSFIRYFNFSFS